MRYLIGFVIASCALAASGPAVANAADDVLTRSTTVKVSDLDLTKPEGVAMLDGRIKIAVHKVCMEVDSSLHARALSSRCMREAKVMAFRQRDLAIARAENGAGATKLASANGSAASR
ncbi:UrcA family protein [Sphingomonas sp.]|uniref:UrcA family protein n=1 Tax=Sphingomonas sp. TaxID=28214 RepID=UPI0025E96665|nr:UrcA family protein [Sphingomonas sp.]